MPRILVVDEDDEAARILAELLATGGHETSTSSSRREAVETLARLRPDVLVLSIGLSADDGYAVARAARRLPGGGAAIIALGGFSGTAAVAASPRAGCDVHLVKPAALEDVEAALRVLLARDTA